MFEQTEFYAIMAMHEDRRDFQKSDDIQYIVRAGKYTIYVHPTSMIRGLFSARNNITWIHFHTLFLFNYTSLTIDYHQMVKGA